MRIRCFAASVGLGLSLAACAEVAPLGDAPAGAPVGAAPDAGDVAAEPLILEGFPAFALPTESSAEPLPEPPSEGIPEGLGPPYPVVLVHGFSGFTDFGPLDYFFQIVAMLEDEGHEVFAPALPPYNGSDERAQVLAAAVDDILADTGRRKVHLIAHSQGGVDSRRLIAGLGYDDRVSSLTTIATPHRGTPLADAAEDAPDSVLNPAGQMLGWLIGALENPPSDQAWITDQGQDVSNPALAAAARQLSTFGMGDFNALHPDPPGVPIFSVVGYSNLVGAPDFCDDGLLFPRSGRIDPVDPLLVSSGLLLSGLNPFSPRANDGIVPSDSMRWGTLLGCVPADHFDEVGQIADLLPHVMSGFDHREMYRALVENARRVEAADDEGAP